MAKLTEVEKEEILEKMGNGEWWRSATQKAIENKNGEAYGMGP